MSANGQQGEASSAKAGLAILLIDDRPEVASAMEIAFRMAGHSLTVVHEPEEAFSQLARSRFDGIVLDLNFTPGKSDGKEGLACLARIMADDPAACVVVLTAHGGVRMAVAAMQAGARDFAVKPWNNVDLIGKVEAAVAREPTVPAAGATAAERTMPPARILGESAPIEELRQLIRRVGPTMAGVAITGPSGAGRMLSALAVHAASADAQNMPLRIDLREEGALDAIGDASGSVILRYPDRRTGAGSPRRKALRKHSPDRDRRPARCADPCAPPTNRDDRVCRTSSRAAARGHPHPGAPFCDRCSDSLRPRHPAHYRSGRDGLA